MMIHNILYRIKTIYERHVKRMYIDLTNHTKVKLNRYNTIK